MKEDLGNVRTNFYFLDFLFPCGVIFVRKILPTFIHTSTIMFLAIKK